MGKKVEKPEVKVPEVVEVQIPGGAVTARVVTDSNTKTKEITVIVPVVFVNPYFVVNEAQKPIGVVALSLRDDAFECRLILDHHTPERLMYDTEPNRVKLIPQLAITSEQQLVGRFMLKVD